MDIYIDRFRYRWIYIYIYIYTYVSIYLYPYIYISGIEGVGPAEGEGKVGRIGAGSGRRGSSPSNRPCEHIVIGTRSVHPDVRVGFHP